MWGRQQRVEVPMRNAPRLNCKLKTHCLRELLLNCICQRVLLQDDRLPTNTYTVDLPDHTLLHTFVYNSLPAP